LTPPAPAEQKRQILAAATQAKTPAPAGETRNSGQADAAAKASQPLQATSPPRTSQATPSPQPPYLKKEDRPSPNARTIVRAEAKPAPPVPAQQSKPASVQTPLEVHGGVEAGMALSASVPSEPRKAARVPPDGALEKSIKADVIALKRFRDADDEAGMIMVLERLASNYLRRKDHRKASHCLAAAVVFREKLGLEQGKERVIQQRGLVREILGDSTGALEDFTWALALSNAKSGSRTSGQLELRSKKLANQMRLDEHKALAAYRLLWKARKEGDPQGETEACYTIAGLYEKANKPTEAVSYYERSIASILADKARVYQKMGNAARAEESYALALETFRKLDYPKYVNLMKQLKAAKTLSKQ
jgi:tetratricopeptide (TPR) repeat protein